MNRCIAFILLIFSQCCTSEEIVAVLNLKYIKDTEKTAAVLCFGDAGEDCAQWATHYLFEAKVKKLISGELLSKKFNVLFGRHALKKENIKGMVAQLEKTEDYPEAQYTIIEVGNKMELYCFKSNKKNNYNTEIASSEHALLCYEQE